MAELGHFYPWASMSYLLDEMTMDQWLVYYDYIPTEQRLPNTSRQKEPDRFLDVIPVNGVRRISR